jgi:nitrate reductase cytochrome c-type subunit
LAAVENFDVRRGRAYTSQPPTIPHSIERYEITRNVNDSLECRNCHAYRYMDWTRQSQRAVYVHSTALAGEDYTCIDCHKGIAHRLPNMEGIEMLHGAPLEHVPSHGE